MASPVADVLETYELLEAVLINLPFKDLFVLQRVNSSWSALIKRSAALQKIMFLLPESEPLTLVGYEEPACPGPSGIYGRWDVAPEYAGKVRLCPLLWILCKECHPFFAGGKCPYKFSVCLPESPEDSTLIYVDNILATSDLETPSCGKMLLLQPPVKAVRYTGRQDTTFTIYNPNGVRLIDIAHTREKLPEMDRHDGDNILFSVTDGVSHHQPHYPCCDGSGVFDVDGFLHV